jgi:hypothetical protein
MTALPPVLQAALAVVLALSIRWAFFGPPPEHGDRVAAAGWMLAGVLILGTVVVAGDVAKPRDLLAALGVEALCIAAWLLRHRRDDGGGGDGGGGPGPIDWDEFDRARGSWRPRDPAGV